MTSPYRVVLESSVERSFDKLDTATRVKLLRAILGVLETAPRGLGKKIKKLVGVRHGYRLRIGDWRVLYLVHDSEQRVVVYQIDRRDRVYR